MAASQFHWNPDGSATIIVKGKSYNVGVGGVTPGQSIVVGGVRVTVPQPPVQPKQVQPYLLPEQQAQIIDLTGKWTDILNQANLGLKQAGIQLNELDLPSIALRSQQQQESVAESMAGRGLSMSGIRDSAVLDVERARTMAETAAKAAFQAAQDRLDAATNQVNSERSKWEDWANTTAGRNAAIDNSDIPPADYSPVALKPTPKPGAGGTPQPAAPAPLPAIKPGQPGVAQPATPTSYASGPPPGPNYVWNGTRWVKLGQAQPAMPGQYSSGPPPGPNYYWNGTRWVKAAHG